VGHVRRCGWQHVIELFEARHEVGARAIELQTIAGGRRLALKLRPAGSGRRLRPGGQPRDVLLVATRAC